MGFRQTIRRSKGRNPRYAAFFWSETIELRLASKVERIRHWTIIEGSSDRAPDIEAHWHIDPPYQNPDLDGCIDTTV